VWRIRGWGDCALPTGGRRQDFVADGASIHPLQGALEARAESQGPSSPGVRVSAPRTRLKSKAVFGCDALMCVHGGRVSAPVQSSRQASKEFCEPGAHDLCLVVGAVQATVPDSGFADYLVLSGGSVTGFGPERLLKGECCCFTIRLRRIWPFLYVSFEQLPFVQ